MLRIIGFVLGVSLIGLGSTASFADDVVEITIEESAAESSQTAARQAIFEKVIHDTSLKYILDIIGEQKYARNKVTVNNKILKNSGKYVLAMKSTPPVKSAKGFTMSVTMKFSIKNLQALLLEQGLLYKLEGAPKVIPMVSFQDRVNGQSYSWWMPQSDGEMGFVTGQSRDFLGKLRREMRERGFFSLIPMGDGHRNMMPSAFMSESPRTEDFLFLGEYFESQIVVRGFIRYGKSRNRSDAFQIDVKIAALHSGNGRVVGEVIRTYETDAGSFQTAVQRKVQEVTDTVAKDLSVQIYDAWKRGTFGANLLRLAINGNLDYQQLNDLKKMLVGQVRDIRTLKERFFDGDRVVFEMDASSGTRQIASLLEKQSFKPFKVNVSKVSSDSLEIDVR